MGMCCRSASINAVNANYEFLRVCRASTRPYQAQQSSPGGVYRLTHDICRVGALLRTKLLHPSAIHFRDVKVSFLVHAETVYAPEAAGEVAPHAPGIKEVSGEVVLQHPGGSAIESPECPVGADINKVDVGRIFARTPFVQILAVLIEDLNSMVGAIIHEDTPGLRIDGDSVHIIHISRTFFVWRITSLSPIEKELAVLIELRDSRSVVAVRHEHRAVWKPRQKCRPIEVRAVGAGHFGGADSLREFFAVVRKLVNGMHVIIQDPNMLFRIVRIDGNEMGTLQNLIP